MAARALLLALAAAVFGAGLGARDLWNPNEPLYGRAIVEMAASGDRLLPTVNGERFPEKPPLYYWLALGAARVTGAVDETSLRLPSLLAGLVAVVLLFSFVERTAGRRRAWIAGAIFATTFGVAWAARSIQMDLLIVATTLGAVHAAWAPPRPSTRWLSPVLAGIAAGIGALAKGPVGLVCPAIVLGVDALCSAESRRFLRPAWLVPAVLAAFAVSLPWYLLVAVQGEGGVLEELLWRQNVTRFFAPWDHARPWWYFLGAFWIEAAPWGPLVLLALRGREPDAASRSIDRLAWVWLLALVAFFSLSASKRGAYLLPAMPAVAILASGVLDRVARGVATARSRRGVWAVVGGTAGLLAVSASVAAVRADLPPGVAAPARVLAGVQILGAGAVAWAFVLRRSKPLGTAAALGATVAATWIVAGLWALPAANELKSARSFCRALNARVAHDVPLRSFGSWRWRASYVYYADRVIPRLETESDLAAFFRRDEPVFLLVERGALPDARRVLGPVEPVLSAEIGSNAVYLLTNRATPREDPPGARTPPTGGAASDRGA